MESLFQQAFFIDSNLSLAASKGISETPRATHTVGLASPVRTLFSHSALRNWLKLLLLGGFFEACRRAASILYRKVTEAFFVTAHFEEDDSSYDWMMVWLSKQPSWANVREVQVSTQTFGLNSTAVLVPGEEDALNGGRRIAYFPSVSTTYSLWYKGHWMNVSRMRTTGAYHRQGETLRISILARHHRILNELLLEAKREYISAQEHSISIYVSDANNNWRHIATRAKRPLSSIVLDPGVKDLLLSDALDFMESKSWYATRGIPFRRGYLLYGVPGSGKTSIIHSLAGELKLDVYILSLSRAGLDDTALSKLISDLPERCIALMEDIDAAFTQSLNRDNPPEILCSPIDSRTTSRITLSGLLNALDGVGAQEGRLLYATTNKYTALDPALCRPGRMDIHVEFKLASKYQIGELFRCFYLPEDHNDSKGQVERDVLDSGYASVTTHPSTPILTPQPNAIIPNGLAFKGKSHRTRAPRLSNEQLLDLVEEFTKVIPDGEFSMATLQGYLMAYKTQPFEAVVDAPAWVKNERLNCVTRISCSR
ncbi:P-loop containing nucleoside triphosphate hydrolase protein [Infundibulicybe gibba]|nr:P-loop containing nucleoside triphosphate hydrolase protein [Infundibulicybe gibba]